MLVEMCLHLEVRDISEPMGRNRAEEEGAAAQALDWACMVSPPEESGGASVQLQPCGAQETPEFIHSLPPTLQQQGDTTLTI